MLALVLTTALATAPTPTAAATPLSQCGPSAPCCAQAETVAAPCPMPSMTPKAGGSTKLGNAPEVITHDRADGRH